MAPLLQILVCDLQAFWGWDRQRPSQSLNLCPGAGNRRGTADPRPPLGPGSWRLGREATSREGEGEGRVPRLGSLCWNNDQLPPALGPRQGQTMTRSTNLEPTESPNTNAVVGPLWEGSWAPPCSPCVRPSEHA